MSAKRNLLDEFNRAGDVDAFMRSCMLRHVDFVFTLVGGAASTRYKELKEIHGSYRAINQMYAEGYYVYSDEGFFFVGRNI